MDQSQINNLMYRIIYGEHLLDFLGQVYLIKQPSLDIKYNAQLLYNKVVKDGRFYPWIRREQCSRLLVDAGLLRPTYQQDLKSLSKSLEDHKINLYNNFVNISKQKSIRKFIQQTKEKINDIDNVVNSLDHFTIVGYAATQQFEYLLIHTVYNNEDKKLVYTTHSNTVNYELLTTALISTHLIQEQYKTIARNYIWRNYWQAMPNPFPNHKYFTDEQQQLIYYTKMYENIYKNTECPPEEVINDDDMLDGWLLKQHRETEQGRKEKQADKLTTQHKNAQEIFVMANTEEDRQRVAEMNTIQSQMVKKQRQQTIQQKGMVRDKEFIDKKLENRQQAQQAYIQHVRDMKK